MAFNSRIKYEKVNEKQNRFKDFEFQFLEYVMRSPFRQRTKLYSMKISWYSLISFTTYSCSLLSTQANAHTYAGLSSPLWRLRITRINSIIRHTCRTNQMQ